jgi:hypothetical protein
VGEGEEQSAPLKPDVLREGGGGSAKKTSPIKERMAIREVKPTPVHHTYVFIPQT